MLRNPVALLAVLLVGLVASAPGPAFSQCVLANPSFELPGTAGAVFAGWNQFGAAGISPSAAHGAAAARLAGPDTGTWAVSAYWQRLDTSPGESWAASVSGWHDAAAPLQGGARAILNIEWRDAADGLISYESHTVADAATPADEVRRFTVVSGPAPAGAVATHLLLGVLQGPGDPVPVVFYDDVIFEMTGSPTIDELQWADFPGGRTLDFGGRTWRVKGPGLYGPGPNVFCETSSCVWVDAGGDLHLTVQDDLGTLLSTEIVLEEPLGYGDYVFTTVGRLDQLDPNVVLGLFLWQYPRCWDAGNEWWNPYNEADIEFSRWGMPDADLGQFVVQPWNAPGNLQRFAAVFADGEVTSHAMRWLPDRIEYRSWRGGSDEEPVSAPIHAWTYAGPHLPRADQPRVHINFWALAPGPAADQEVVLREFRFEPAPDSSAVDVPWAEALAVSRLRVAPNPFREQTSLHFTLDRPGDASVDVFDVRGRRVRRVLDRNLAAGPRQVAWDGRDAEGRLLPPGVYFVRLHAPGRVESRRVVRVP